MGRRYFGGNSGYVGYSKSVRAVNAERRGLRSKSQMDKNFLEEVNALLPKENQVTLKQIKDNLKFINADEWHHTSMYGNKTDYYSAENIASYFDYDTKKENDSETIAKDEIAKFYEKKGKELSQLEKKYDVSILIGYNLGLTINKDGKCIYKEKYDFWNLDVDYIETRIIYGLRYNLSMQEQSTFGILMF